MFDNNNFVLGIIRYLTLYVCSNRKFYGPHICGDALDIDPVHDHIITGSWRKDNTLQIWDFGTAEKIKDVPQDHLHGSLVSILLTPNLLYYLPY